MLAPSQRISAEMMRKMIEQAKVFKVLGRLSVQLLACICGDKSCYRVSGQGHFYG